MNKIPKMKWLAGLLLGVLLLSAACSGASEPPVEKDTVLVSQESEEGRGGMGDLLIEKPAADGSTPVSPLAYPFPVTDQMDSSRAQPMVIKNAELTLLVRDTGEAINQVNQLIADYAGYLLSSRSWYEDQYQHATLSLGVPSVNYELVLTQLRQIGLQVINESASGEDVTAEYVDLQSRLENLEATAARVRSFLDDTKTVEEALIVNQKLAELEVQIEQIEGQMQYLKGRAAYSTISIILVPETPLPTPRPTESWDPGRTFRQASRVIIRSGKSLVDTLIWLLVVVIPLALVGGLPLALIAWGLRTWRARQRKVQKSSNEAEGG